MLRLRVIRTRAGDRHAGDTPVVFVTVALIAFTPLTLALVGLLAGYYITDAVGLLRSAVRHPRTQPAGLPT